MGVCWWVGKRQGGAGEGGKARGRAGLRGMGGGGGGREVEVGGARGDARGRTGRKERSRGIIISGREKEGKHGRGGWTLRGRVKGGERFDTGGVRCRRCGE